MQSQVPKLIQVNTWIFLNSNFVYWIKRMGFYKFSQWYICKEAFIGATNCSACSNIYQLARYLLLTTERWLFPPLPCFFFFKYITSGAFNFLIVIFLKRVCVGVSSYISYTALAPSYPHVAYTALGNSCRNSSNPRLLSSLLICMNYVSVVSGQ